MDEEQSRKQDVDGLSVDNNGPTPEVDGLDVWEQASLQESQVFVPFFRPPVGVE